MKFKRKKETIMEKNKVRMLIKMENEEHKAVSATFETNADVDPKIITGLAYSIGETRKNEFKNIELVKVEQNGKDIPKHFTLKEEEAKFTINFDKEIARKTVENGGISLNVIVRKKG